MEQRPLAQGAKYRWLLPKPVERGILPQLASSYNLSIPIVQVLVSRGIISREQIDAFLFSSYEKDVHDPRALKDAEKAVERILHAIRTGEKILIFGDYDVDGITSSSLMMICLLPLGAQVNFFLPHRVRDGYGLSTKVVDRAADNGYRLIITVDNGITAFEPAERAKLRGIDLIITDHHRPHDHVPDAYAIVNPNQLDCSYPFKAFAGVGVAFKILTLLYERLDKQLPAKAYELLLLGTVADVVPLRGENRFWVRYGLSYINRVESASLQALKKNGKVSDRALSSTDIGFSITPQINALGRLEDPRQGVKFLIGTRIEDINEVARLLLELNETRKVIEKEVFRDIIGRVERKEIDITRDKIIIASSNQWPPGVIGLVASRVVAEYGLPTILLHETSQGLLKGSCRSIPAFNMFDALHFSRDLLEQFGGHSIAAGLAVRKDRIVQLKERIELCIAQQLTADDFIQKVKVDAQLLLQDLTAQFVTDMEHLEPFGNDNSVPLFHVDNLVLVQKPTLLKDAHVKCLAFADGIVKPIIFFNRPELYQQFVAKGHEPFRVVAQVNKNYWNGRMNVELTGIDVAFSNQ